MVRNKRCSGRGANETYKWATVHSQRGREDELDRRAALLAVLPRSLEHVADRVDVDLDAQIEVVLRPARHDTVQAVDDIGDAEFGVEELVDLFAVRQVGLDGDGLDALWRLRLDDVGEDELGVGRLAVFDDRLRELQGNQ